MADEPPTRPDLPRARCVGCGQAEHGSVNDGVHCLERALRRARTADDAQGQAAYEATRRVFGTGVLEWRELTMHTRARWIEIAKAVRAS